MANDLIQRKYYIVDTEDSLPSEIVDGSIYYVKSNNALYIDMSSTRRRINPDYSNKLDANQGYINAGKSLSIDDNGNIIPVENINIDPTLKNQGQAADAKITGQALGELYDYFEGLQQIIENLDGPTTVTTDATLSNQGVPADAKATGDRLDSMQSELNVLEPTATASDIGKTLKVKTVANGKVSKYELGDMMIDNTLTQTGWAADAKKVGSELSSVKDEVRNESQARTTADNALREDINDDLAQIQAQISSVYGAPSTASTVAQMTDHTKAYVYTGEESGYVTGNWYYWNGSSWVSGGVYNAVAIQTDKSLTLDGKAADAKTVGDELNDLKDDFNNFSDIRVITNFDTVQKTYADTRTALTGTVVSGYTWNKSTGVQDSNSNGKYARFDNVGQYETLYVSGCGIDADHRMYAFYTENNTLISAQSGSGASGGEQLVVSVPENADYVIINTLYSTGDTGRDIDPACFALKAGEQDITENMLTAQGTVTEGYAWRPGQTPLQNSSCKYTRYNTIPDSGYVYVSGRAYRVSAPLVSFYNNSDELISSYGANSLTYYDRIEIAVPVGTSYFIANGTNITPIVYYPHSASKKTQRDVNNEVNTELTNIKTILDNIDPLSIVIKEALLNCFKYVYWTDDKGHDAYEELKEALMGTQYIYKLEEPLVVDGTTGYLVTDVAPFTEDRSFTMFIDYTEGGRDWTVSSVVADTIIQVKDVTANKTVIASTFKTTNSSTVTTRISIFGIQYSIRQPKENAGNRRIRYGVSYDADSRKYMALISVNGTVIAPSEDQTNSEVPFVETDAALNIGCSNVQAEILRGTVNDLRILNRTTSQADLTAYVTGQ